MPSGLRRDVGAAAPDTTDVTKVEGPARVTPSATPPPVGPSAAGSASVEIGEVIAEGGMGVVRAAVQRSLGRAVAVKTAPAHATSDDAKRMLLEAWVTGYLEHPGVVPIYDIVEGEGDVPVVVMRRIRGRTWQSLLDDEEWAKAQGARDLFEQNLRVLIRVCEIVEYAHSMHVLHRDIKPSNVMVGSFGEVYLLDWGLAVATGGEPARHLPRAEIAKDACGTLSYAAPEMVGLIAESVSERTDVYLVGAVLFQLAVGKPPHRATGGTKGTVESIDTTPPQMPRSMSPHIAKICMCAMQKEPKDRYATVAELRSEILAFLRQRDSDHIFREAQRTLARLRDAAKDKAPRETLYDLYGECRFAFREAQRTWPENDDAKRGLLDAARTMIEHELDAKDPRVAAALLAEAPEEIPDLAERVRAALAEDEEQRARLARFARDHDKSIGRRARRLFLICMGIAWSAGQLGERVAPISYRRFIVGSLIQLPLLCIAWAVSPELRSTVFNRRVFGAVAVTIVAQCLLFVCGSMLNVDLVITRLAQVGLWTVVATLLTVVLERKFWPMTVALASAVVAITVNPDWRPYAATLAIAVVTANVALVQVPKNSE
jgi:eukaryotic-like serine/threonine-protein kinase